MPGTIAEGPSVSLSFANNFWGKDDAGVHPLLERMHGAKVTSDELKAFYSARAAIEDDYARKLLALCRKPLGSCEGGTLRASLDTLRGEVESMGKSHQGIAGQMKSELEEPLAAFSGGLKERRKIVQNGVEKLLKVKTQQTQAMNKSRDRYEQDCLRIKGYLAQGHMVMGQEERKNKAKLEKTQIQVATSNNEYEAAVKALEETTTRWNREWKAACDKFQDLEEERLDFMKSSVWSFANIASTVCVSDDGSCEKIRLSLEGCEVEKDIVGFIRDKGTGQEIPDPPKYINFCRGDVNDTPSEISEDENYSVAQFQRTINPAFRSSSPQPSTYDSHRDSRSDLAGHMSARDPHTPSSRDRSRDANLTPQAGAPRGAPPSLDYQGQVAGQLEYQASHHGPLAAVPHNQYPMDGMTMLCRTGPPSDRSTATSPARRSSHDSQSEYSIPTSFSSQDPASGKQSPVKALHGVPAPAPAVAVAEGKNLLKKKSGFFQSHSPFRRKSKHEKEPGGAEPASSPAMMAPSAGRNTWSASTARTFANAEGSPTRAGPMYGSTPSQAVVLGGARQSGSPEPVDPRANFQLNVGANVFDVDSPDACREPRRSPVKSSSAGVGAGLDDLDPIAAALAELKGVSKQSSVRMSADRYHGLQTPAPSNASNASGDNGVQAAQRGTPPPSYDQPMKRLDLPQPAFTSASMQQTRQKYVDQAQHVFGRSTGGAEPASPYGSPYAPRSQPRPGTQGSSGSGSDLPRATSPAPLRSTSPRPGYGDGRQGYRSASPHAYGDGAHARMNSVSPHKRGSPQGSAVGYESGGHPTSMCREGDERYGGSQRSRAMTNQSGRPLSYYHGAGPDAASGGQPAYASSRARSKSVSDGRQFTRDGRPILHFARAQYLYQAAIPEELSFSKGDILAVLRLQDDGWWEAEVAGKNGRPGLVPSNYLQPI
ncbi:MAG: hypothetical protein M1838_003196 [Thelocarpon superellum]|nr:MAG: hypothetical protein M1838_003196 [Thelocarpon superellum]